MVRAFLPIFKLYFQRAFLVRFRIFYVQYLFVENAATMQKGSAVLKIKVECSFFNKMYMFVRLRSHHIFIFTSANFQFHRKIRNNKTRKKWDALTIFYTILWRRKQFSRAFPCIFLTVLFEQQNVFCFRTNELRLH